MAQPSVTLYFNSRKRSAADDLCSRKNKIIHLEESHDTHHEAATTKLIDKKILLNDLTTIEPRSSPRIHANTKNKIISGSIADGKKSTTATKRRSCLKRSDTLKKDDVNQPKIVQFTLAGPLSPKKRPRSNDDKLSAILGSLGHQTVVQKEMELHTPTKEQQLAEAKAEQQKQAVQNLSLGEIKQKIIKSDRLKELKESLSKLRAMDESRQKCIKLSGDLSSNFDRNAVMSPQKSDAVQGKNLKQFDCIELEVLSR